MSSDGFRHEWVLALDGGTKRWDLSLGEHRPDGGYWSPLLDAGSFKPGKGFLRDLLAPGYRVVFRCDMRPGDELVGKARAIVLSSIAAQNLMPGSAPYLPDWAIGP